MQLYLDQINFDHHVRKEVNIFYMGYHDMMVGNICLFYVDFLIFGMILGGYRRFCLGLG